MAATSISGTFGVAGANINNMVEGGIPIPAGGTGTSGGSAPTTVLNKQGPIGAYVQDALNPSGDTNYVGVNTGIAFKTNVLEEDITNVDRTTNFTAYINDDAAEGDVAVWAKAAGTIAKDGRCEITAATGVMTSNASGTYVCKVAGGVVINDYAWFPVFA
jgi:hypothetical protein